MMRALSAATLAIALLSIWTAGCQATDPPPAAPGSGPAATSRGGVVREAGRMYLELGRERDGDLSLYVLDAEGRRLSVAGVRGATAVVRHSATESVEVTFFPIGPGLVGPLQARWTSFTATVTVPYDGAVLTAEFTVGDGRSGGTR